MTDQKTNTDWKKRELGALWKKEGKSQNYFSGRVKINGANVNIVGFANKSKEKSPNSPDVILYTSELQSSETSLDLASDNSSTDVKNDVADEFDDESPLL